MVDKIREHEVLPGKRQCEHCGQVDPKPLDEEGKGHVCVWRDAPPQMAPEPKRRTYACNDADAISQAMRRLREERQAALNTPMED